ncbi:RNA 2',3'-cyclic phosphodiesterase [Roseovarius sp. TE539]|uniref:RNA 2',3'-cyclic phosphodiesterase n=1 Tax=Roseovarius sp. TE539 TaxID=2249812 RepID=UPI000DDD69C8|nr:RNA 2',3'-cyclic phosphodiesterase [Roseovarius sp. TE539]RBI76935.1 RNA 2',3'-cyclic phosphodiesterase [Roseovarius sp. TE539]
MRLFVSIPISGSAAGELARLQADLSTGRHVEPGNFHVTLAFLGDQDVATAEAVHELLSEIDMPGFHLGIGGLGVFGDRNPRLVHAMVEKCPWLVRLREKVRGAIRTGGVEMPRERFRPHVTLARFPRQMEPQDRDRLGRFLQAHGDLSLPPFPVEEFHFCRSHLGPAGPDYEALAEYPLRAPENA